MIASNKQGRVLSLFVAVLLAVACRNGGTPAVTGGRQALAGEPESYAATVVRTFEDGDRREVSQSRMARSGDFRREEWVEQGEHRALIWRPDLGFAYVLDVDRRLYGKFPIGEKAAGVPDEALPADATGLLIDPQAIDRAFDDASMPVKVEARALPDQFIDGYQCEVSEQHASFADGHIEITRLFRARDLAGLAIRVETESNKDARRLRAVTERRDIQLDVPSDQFSVPDGFRRDDKLTLR